MHTGRWRLLSLMLFGLGLIVSGYLMARSFGLVVNRYPHAMDVRAEIFGAGCEGESSVPPLAHGNPSTTHLYQSVIHRGGEEG